MRQDGEGGKDPIYGWLTAHCHGQGTGVHARTCLTHKTEMTEVIQQINVLASYGWISFYGVYVYVYVYLPGFPLVAGIMQVSWFLHLMTVQLKRVSMLDKTIRLMDVCVLRHQQLWCYYATHLQSCADTHTSTGCSHLSPLWFSVNVYTTGLLWLVLWPCHEIKPTHLWCFCLLIHIFPYILWTLKATKTLRPCIMFVIVFWAERYTMNDPDT